MLAVTTYRYRSQRSDEPLRSQLVELARAKPRFGYRRLHVLLRRSGERVNHKRLHRIYREAGLMIRRKKRKHGVRVGQPLPPNTACAILLHKRFTSLPSGPLVWRQTTSGLPGCRSSRRFA
jgi:transposase InsO family protein